MTCFFRFHTFTLRANQDSISVIRKILQKLSNILQTNADSDLKGHKRAEIGGSNRSQSGGAEASGVWFAASCRKRRLPIFLNGIANQFGVQKPAARRRCQHAKGVRSPKSTASFQLYAGRKRGNSKKVETAALCTRRNPADRQPESSILNQDIVTRATTFAVDDNALEAFEGRRV